MGFFFFFFNQLISFFCVVSSGQFLDNRKTLPNVVASLLPGMQKEIFAEVNIKNDNDYTLMAHNSISFMYNTSTNKSQ